MILALICIIVTIFLIWLQLKWRKVKRYWAERKVPHDPPHLVLGSLTFLQKENTALWIRRMYEKFRTPYIGIWVFWRPGMIINSPDLARRILVKDADNFRNRLLGSGKSDPIGAMNIFTVNDPMWSSIRRRLTAVFTASKLRSLQCLIKQKADDLVVRLAEEMKNPEKFHLRVVCTDYTTDVIGESAFGFKSEATRTGDSVMRKITRDFMKFSVFRGLSWSSIFFFPELVDFFGFSMFPKDTTRFLRQLFRSMVEQRGGLDKEVKESRDLLDALIKLRQEAQQDNEEISEDVLLAQAAIFLQGGFDTSGAALTWTFYELAHQPDIQDKLYKELMEAKEKYGTDQFDSNQLAELTYMNAVLKETLRKYPPMGWLDRIASHDYVVDEHVTLAAGSVVYVNAYGMHMDADHFPEPETYDPDRFMPENEKNIKPYTYLPFGDGPRNCIGMRFAHLTMRFALSAVCLNYNIRTLPNTPKPNECHIEEKGMFLMPDEQMPVLFVPRNKA